jgi:hypothetical protein
VFRAVEFAGNEPAVPGEDGIGFGDTGHVLERRATEPLADLSQRGSLGIRKAHTGRKVRPEDSIFGGQILILEQEFLIDQAGDVRQEPSPFCCLA